MNEEIDGHLEHSVQRLMARGMNPAEARTMARRDFGNVTSIKEQARRARGVRWLEELRQDVRYAIRSLRKTPVLTAVAVISLTLGIGLNAALFTVLRETFYAETGTDPATLVGIEGPRSWATFEYLRQNARSVTEVFGRSTEWVLVAPDDPVDEPLEVTLELVTSSFFPALRGRPMLGRTFLAEETTVSAAPPVAVLSHRLWRTRFASDSTVLGRELRLLTGVSFRIVGVMPIEFSGADPYGPEFWVPVMARPLLPTVARAEAWGTDWFGSAGVSWLRIHGRLASSRTITEARAELAGLLRQVDGDTAITARPERAIRTAAASGAEEGGERLTIGLVMGASLTVLLIACANIANLILARAAARQPEIALRLCLGASRRRLIRQLLTESLLLAMLGGAVGLIVVTWALRALVVVGGLEPMFGRDPELLGSLLAPDLSVFAFAMATTVLSAAIFGLAPALQATRPDLVRAIKGEGSALGSRMARSRFRGGLVVAQVALSLVLLVSAGVLVRSVHRALELDPGFDRARVLVLDPIDFIETYDSARVARFQAALDARLPSVPGASGVARGPSPLGYRARASLGPPGTTPETHRDGVIAPVSPTYFATLGIPIARGRGFSDDDAHSGAPVVIVSERTAETLWPGADAIGQTLSIHSCRPASRCRDVRLHPSATVIGLARDAQVVELGEVPAVLAYLPAVNGRFHVQVVGDPAAVASRLRDLARSIDPQVPITIESVDEILRSPVRSTRQAARFASMIGALALALAAAGIFGVVSYSVSQRTHELGIRTALGARPGQVVALVLRHGLKLVGAGVAFGLAGGLVASRSLSALLFGMSPLDPVAYASVALLIAGVGLLACVLPARRAVRVDPVIALRND